MNILFPGDDMMQVASQFKQASSDLQGSMKNLDSSIAVLENKWSGATQQVFYRKYKDLHQAMEGMSALMNNIAKEMEAMVDHMKSIDAQDGEG